MSLIEILRSIFINIKGSKAKVFLTTLGVIVGALTIVLVIAIGEGSQASIEEQYKSLNVGTLYIAVGMRGPGNLRLSINEMEAIKEEAPSIQKVSMMITSNATVNLYTTSTSTSVAGATEDLKEISNLTVEYGEFITNEHNDDSERVAVLGYDVATLFFENDPSEAIGERVMINGKRYEIIGVLKKQNSAMMGFNPDSGILIPYKVAEKNLTGRNARPTIVALATDVNHVGSAIEEINVILQKNFKSNSQDFMIMDAGSTLQAAKDSERTMTLMLLSVAVVVLIVGGIGIMNVLFVSVKERTKEIGILKAIGTRKKDILLIFLLEAIIISALGGAIGILGSMLIIPMMNYFDIRAIPTLYGYVLAFCFALGIGTFFGYYPAAKAAALKPIDALNYE